MRALLIFSSLACACAYPSQYAAPLDGRARAVWTGSGVAVDLAGGPLTERCATQLGAYGLDGRIHLLTGELKPEPLDANDRPYAAAPSLWVPIYYGAPLIAIAGAPPLLPRPPLFAPSLARVDAPNARAPARPVADELAHLGAMVAVVAILVLPVVDLALALAPAENGTRAAEAIDQVNVYNDLARSMGSPCAYGAP